MADLYVSANGSDSNDGSQTTPFRTILAASQVARPGVTVHVGHGTYAGGFITTASGTATAPITYVSDTPGGAVIVGNGRNANIVSILGGDTAWFNRGSNVNIVGFQVDGSGSQATSWDMGLYNDGSNSVYRSNVVHDIMVDPTEFAWITASGYGGAGIMNDSQATGATNDAAIGNLVYNIGPAGQSSFIVHGIYQTATGSVENNVIYDVVGDGIELWHGSQHINIVNNTIDHVGGGGIEVGSGGDGSSSTSGDYNYIADNIVSNTKYGIYEDGTTGIHNIYIDNLTFNNLVWDYRLHNGLTASGALYVDPMFVSAATHDYQLQAGSPAIGAGTLDGAPTADYAGTPRAGSDDLGAYQTTAIAPAVPAPMVTDTSPPPPAMPDAPPPPSPPPLVTPDTLVLVLSDDRGGAHFIAKMDGKQVGTGDVTAHRLGGATQTFTYSDIWGAGPHTVEIDFTNSKARHLYVDQVTYNGAAALSSPDVLSRNSLVDITVGQTV